MEKKYDKIYIAIDLKSFYASVECRERGLDPLTTHLVVADSSRTEKTICLAVSPSLKAYGISGRARLYEVVQKVSEINAKRKIENPSHRFTCSSYDDVALKKNKDLELTYIIAPPRMGYYMKYSNKIYNIYLKWFSKEDIYVYSIDEVFIDITQYLNTYKMTPRELVTKVIQDVMDETGITATAGIGTNLYLAKVAMDIVAKHTEADKNGVRIAGLDELAYRKFLWGHRPLTDFWRIGKGISQKLEKHGIYTMGDIARASINDEEILYKLFGINAELIIDHSWGYEPCTMESIKSYKPTTNSISSGQVLHCPYTYEKARLIVKEMTELLTLDLVQKNLVTSKLVLTVGYDVDNLKNTEISRQYFGDVTLDFYGRKVPKHAHGTINIDHKTSSTKIILQAMLDLYDEIINKKLLIRRIYVTAEDVVNEEDYRNIKSYEQMNLFIDYSEVEKQRKKEAIEKSLQKAVINIKSKYGKNAILKGMNFMEGGTTISRNGQIGGHKG
ncbi:MAG: DNA methylase [Clostridia bacterium]|nr:DNA methylase [Clostridia bacterium]